MRSCARGYNENERRLRLISRYFGQRLQRCRAFLAGAVTDSEWFDRKQMDLLRHHMLLTVMPVFFLSTGLKTNWDHWGAVVFFVAALLLVASVAGKLLGIHIAGRILEWAPGEASLIGWLLQTKAPIMIILVNVLLDKGLVPRPRCC